MAVSTGAASNAICSITLQQHANHAVGAAIRRRTLHVDPGVDFAYVTLSNASNKADQGLHLKSNGHLTATTEDRHLYYSKSTKLVVRVPNGQPEVLAAYSIKEAQISDPVIKCQSQTVISTTSAEACYSDIQDEATLHMTEIAKD